MQAEQTTAGDKEAHLIFAMTVLIKKFFAQFGLLRVITVQADHIHSLITLLGNQPVNIGAIGGNHFFLAVAWCDAGVSLPLFKSHTGFIQRPADFNVVAAVEGRVAGIVIVINADCTHG